MCSKISIHYWQFLNYLGLSSLVMIRVTFPNHACWHAACMCAGKVPVRAYQGWWQDEQLPESSGPWTCKEQDCLDLWDPLLQKVSIFSYSLSVFKKKKEWEKKSGVTFRNAYEKKKLNLNKVIRITLQS